MKLLICESDPEIAGAIREAVYDAGCIPVGPATSVSCALGLADERRPAIAIVDLSKQAGGQAIWLAERLAERGIDLICLTHDGAIADGLALGEAVFVPATESRAGLAKCIKTRAELKSLPLKPRLAVNAGTTSRPVDGGRAEPHGSRVDRTDLNDSTASIDRQCVFSGSSTGPVRLGSRHA